MSINKRNLAFKAIENKDLDKIVKENSIEKRVPRKEVFMGPGESLDCLYYIKKGRTRHSMYDKDGTEKILYVLTNGWFFGELALVIDHNETSLSSEAETDSILYVMKLSKAKELLDSNHIFREAIMRSLAFKTVVMRYEMGNILFNSAKDRLKRFISTCVNLDDVNESEWIDIETKYTHYEIGVLIGSTRVTVSKMMNQLVKEKFIRVINKNIQVNKKAYLEYISRY